MRPRVHLLSALVVLALAVGAQIAFTDVGREVGGDWEEPTELSALGGGSTASVPDVAAAGGGGEGGGAVVAWVETEAGTYRVRVAELTRSPDGVTVTGVRTLLETDEELREVDAAARGDRLAVAVENAAAERITLLRTDREGGEVTETTVSSGEAARVESVDVAALADGTAVAWRAYDDGFAGRLAVVPVGSGNATVRTLPGASTGRNSPALAAAGDGTLAVAWIDGRDAGVHLAVGPADGDLDGRRVGDARRGASSFSSANLPAVVDVASARAGDPAPVLAWTDLSVVHVRVAVGADGDGSAPATFGSGDRLRVAGDADDWTATWTVADRTSGRDLVFARGGGDLGEGVERGHVSRLPSNALAAAPVYVGDAPAVAWVERGGDRRLLVSGYVGGGPAGPGERLAATPLRFGFVAVVAGALAVVTVPLLPWVAGPLLVGFLVTTRTVLSAVGAVHARLAGLVGRPASPGDVHTWVQEAPAWAALAAFVPANLAVLAALGDGGVVPGVPAVDPFGLSALALAATLAVAWVRDIRSSWRLVFAYGYCQSVALWAAAAPAFL
ncbi:hypothetical protein [Halobaculum sp. EA56]|uniref:hypothetical protein n=1 Tax=Halobaculum sp. EA56 TaxID=3421648 RepID=UPI003EC0598F